jgi:hypothetical protein
MLSRLQESDPDMDTSGATSWSRGSRGVRNLLARATAQLRFPWIGRHHHGLVIEGCGRQAGHVEHGIPGFQLDLGPPPGHIKAAIEVRIGVTLRTGDEDLFDARQRSQGLLAAHGVVGGHFTPPQSPDAFGIEVLLERAPRPGGSLGAGIQEHYPRREPRLRVDTGLGGHPPQVVHRQAHQQAATIPRQPVRRYRATVGEALQGLHRGCHDAMTRLTVQVGDQPEAAAVALESFRPKAVCRRYGHRYPVPTSSPA